MADVTYLVDGTNLEVAGVRLMEVIEGTHVTPSLRGELPQFAGIDGVMDVDQPFDSTVISFGLVVVGPTRQQFNDNYKTLRRLIKVGKTVTLTRTLSSSGGDQVATAVAKFDGGLEPAQMAPGVFRMVLRMRLLSGLWYGATSVQSITPGLNTITPFGDTITKRMTVTLTGGTTPTLRNATLDYELSFGGSMGSPVVIDVQTGTATQGATDVTADLTFNRVLPFALLGGSTNSITLSSTGSASISYSPAHL